jgi:hypothetical protein
MTFGNRATIVIRWAVAVVTVVVAGGPAQSRGIGT